MPAPRKTDDAAAAAEPAPVADGTAAVEAAPALTAEPEPVDAAPPVAEPVAAPEQQPAHPDDLWQHDERVDLIFTGESGTIVFPMAGLENGEIKSVPRTLAASYIASGLFSASNS